MGGRIERARGVTAVALQLQNKQGQARTLPQATPLMAMPPLTNTQAHRELLQRQLACFDRLRPRRSRRRQFGGRRSLLGSKPALQLCRRQPGGLLLLFLLPWLLALLRCWLLLLGRRRLGVLLGGRQRHRHSACVWQSYRPIGVCGMTECAGQRARPASAACDALCL